jgi:type II secretory pathway component PulK
MKHRKGMAIPLVLGFLFVAMILGATLIFTTRARTADTQKALIRLQHRHLTQSGLNLALSQIKPRRINELIENNGRSWKIITPREKFGKAEAWCEVRLKIRGENEILVRSDGYWHERGQKPKLQNFSCTATYREYTNRHLSGRTRIHGEWKIRNFREDL